MTPLEWFALGISLTINAGFLVALVRPRGQPAAGPPDRLYDRMEGENEWLKARLVAAEARAQTATETLLSWKLNAPVSFAPAVAAHEQDALALVREALNNPEFTLAGTTEGV